MPAHCTAPAGDLPGAGGTGRRRAFGRFMGRRSAYHARVTALAFACPPCGTFGAYLPLPRVRTFVLLPHPACLARPHPATPAIPQLCISWFTTCFAACAPFTALLCPPPVTGGGCSRDATPPNQLARGGRVHHGAATRVTTLFLSGRQVTVLPRSAYALAKQRVNSQPLSRYGSLQRAPPPVPSPLLATNASTLLH